MLWQTSRTFFVLDPQLIEEREHLVVELGLVDAMPRMTVDVVCAAIVPVRRHAALGPLLFDLARDRMAAMAALDQIAGIEQLMRLICLVEVPPVTGSPKVTSSTALLTLTSRLPENRADSPD
ncbi:MAG: hypothetical protein R3C59_20505 [Planctomycetaceae bacterium]